jgi:hypothetical protein
MLYQNSTSKYHLEEEKFTESFIGKDFLAVMIPPQFLCPFKSMQMEDVVKILSASQQSTQNSLNFPVVLNSLISHAPNRYCPKGHGKDSALSDSFSFQVFSTSAILDRE